MLSALGNKIFLDRYAVKDTARRTLALGDEVLFQLGTQKELGRLVEIEGERVAVEMDGTRYPCPLSHIDKPLETVEDARQRVALHASFRGRANSFNADLPNQQLDYEAFLWLLEDFRFVPGGRIMASLGAPSTTTATNCFVLPCPHDSRAGIIQTLEHMSELMSRGGGVGINISSLRPRYSFVAGVNGRSSGSCSWAELYSFVTGLIIQGGSRRGALMLMMADWHPDILEFVTMKRDMKRTTNANVSVIVSDAFMAAVQNGDQWELEFPCTDAPGYDENWKGNLQEWKRNGGATQVHHTLPASEVWQTVIESAHASAEPGIWFQDRANQERPGGDELVCTNPCGEQGLPAYGVCNLGHVNLARFVIGNAWGPSRPEVDWGGLERAVRTGVNFLDAVVDASYYPLPEIRDQQQSERRVGLGTLGLAEMLIRLGIRYGSEHAETFAGALYQQIAVWAYDESSKLAEQFGPYPAWDRSRFMGSGFGKRLLGAIGKLTNRQAHGLVIAPDTGFRNCTLLTQAPTGTVGTMVGTSTGIEPYYAFVFQREGRMGVWEERVPLVDEYRAAHPDGPLPDYFVTAMELSPVEHTRMQAVIQRWTDASISKTVNFPSSASVDEVREIYELLYKLGCKGGCVYVDKSRNQQVLSLKEEAPPAEPVRDYPAVRDGRTVSIGTPVGTAHITLTRDSQGSPMDVFIDVGRSGSEVKAHTEALGRILSLFLRMQSPVDPETRLMLAIRQLEGIGGSNPLGMGPRRVGSLPDGIGKALLVALDGKYSWPLPANGNGHSPALPAGLDLCPGCGNASLQQASGCVCCALCEYSRC